VDELKKDNGKKLKEMISFASILHTIQDKANEPEQVNEEKIRDYRRFFRSIHNIIKRCSVSVKQELDGPERKNVRSH